MNISPSKLISLLFFIFSGFFLYTAHQIEVFAFDEGAAFNAKTFPIYLGYAGLVFSALFIILPETNPTNVDLKVLDYKKTIGLVILMILYGLTILRAGYFLSTSIPAFCDGVPVSSEFNTIILSPIFTVLEFTVVVVP